MFHVPFITVTATGYCPYFWSNVLIFLVETLKTIFKNIFTILTEYNIFKTLNATYIKCE